MSRLRIAVVALGLAVVVLCLAGVLVVGYSGALQGQTPTPSRVGQQAVLRTTSGGGIVPVAVDEAAWQQMVKTAGDSTAAFEALKAGRVIAVDDATPVLILDWVPASGRAEVRILGGSHKDQTGFTFTDAVR